MEGAVYADLADAADLCDLAVKLDRVDPTEAVELYLWRGLYEDPYDLVEEFLRLLPDCG